MTRSIRPPRILSILLGQYQVSNDCDIIYSTVLGSCISVCLHDQELSIGGMNHFMLPHSQDAKFGNKRYGTHAMEVLIKAMLAAGASSDRMTAKVFGGSSMWDNMDGIGESNASFAIDFLRNSGIPCVLSNIGGTLARRLKFHPASGQVQQFLVPNHSLFEEVQMQTLPNTSTGNDIKLA